jgi:hypothetical protein
MAQGMWNLLIILFCYATIHLDIPAALVSCERFVIANNNVNHKKVYVLLAKDVLVFLRKKY